ncbi:hypothetical protein NUSPORA_02777 [Nucleospora cyclopteri]
MHQPQNKTLGTDLCNRSAREDSRLWRNEWGNEVLERQRRLRIQTHKNSKETQRIGGGAEILEGRKFPGLRGGRREGNRVQQREESDLHSETPHRRNPRRFHRNKHVGDC